VFSIASFLRLDYLRQLYGVEPQKGGSLKWPGNTEMYKYPYNTGRRRQTPRNDEQFKSFLQRENIMQDPDNTLKKWRYGWPGENSPFKSVQKYNAPLMVPEARVLHVCENWLTRHFRCMGDSVIRDDMEYIRQGLNMSTSCGYPWSTQGYTNKRKLFDQNPEEVQRAYAQLRSELLKGNTADLYTLAAKRELRKVSKIEKDDFRTFTASSWRNTALGVALFGDMTSKFYDSNLDTWSFVGGSTFHGIWAKAMTKLMKHPNAFEGDFSNYDAILHRQWFEMLSRVFFSFFEEKEKTPENWILVKNYFEMIVAAYVICPNGDIFQKAQGNPSGSSLTIVVNTMIHYCLFVYAWIELGGPDDYEYFHDNVEALLCGDDSLWTCSDAVVEWFNIETCAAVWNTLGLTMKPENTKRGQMVWRSHAVFTLSFLSHTTIQIGDGTYLPVPDPEKVLSTMLYNSRCSRHLRWSYLKACALRVSSWCDKGLREIFHKYILYLLRERKDELLSPGAKDDPTWAEVDRCYLTDSDLYGLYTMGEGQAL